jgi:hypothetical protein
LVRHCEAQLRLLLVVLAKVEQQEQLPVAILGAMLQRRSQHQTAAGQTQAQVQLAQTTPLSKPSKTF